MIQEEITQLFDQQAGGYDQQWSRLAAINNCLYLLLDSIFAGLSSDASVLCVGAGTGRELIHLAERFPGWRFTAVEPSAAMLDVCRSNVEERGLTDRCEFHNGFLDSLPNGDRFDAATSFLVSQFILSRNDREDLFRQIASLLRPEGILVNTDLSFETENETYESMLGIWFRTMSSADITPEAIEKMKAAYGRDVAVLPAADIEAIIEFAGFQKPVNFFQAGMIRGWFTNRIGDTSSS